MMNETLFALMQQGATIITPNKRLSNELISDFFKTNGKTVQDKPHCFPYSAFLQTQFKKLCHSYPQISHPLVLTNAQFLYLWRKILHNSTALVNDGLLQAVIEAWTRCHLWQIDFNHPAFASTPQTRQFQKWALEFLLELKKIEAITEAQLANYLLTRKGYFHPEILVWACFDDYNPQQYILQKYFKEQNCQLYHYDLPNTKNHLYCHTAQNEDDEYQQLFHWIKQCLAKGEKRIGVVFPELKSKSKQLHRLFQQQFSKEGFNISLGQSLSAYPLVAHALCWLGLDNKKLTAHQLRLLLHSPYLASSQTEMLARAQILEESKVLQEFSFEQNALLNDLKSTPKLATLIKALTIYPEIGSAKDWALIFKARLNALGFPGEYSLDSESYQCYQRFLALLDEFAQLSLLASVMTKEEAFSAFSHLAKSTIFQPKKAEEARIQVLGLLEAAGCIFDSLWVADLTDQALPQNVRFSAFIPISLQREKIMPYSCSEREREIAKKTLNRFANSSKQIVYSYPRTSGDKPNLPHPLIAHLTPFPAVTICKTVDSSFWVKYSENYQIPLIDGEKTVGGTAILANQAKCPFRAFAEHRLHAQAALETSDGPNAKERGQIIHRVMESLWQFLQNQKTLLTLSQEALDKAIEQAIQQALEPIIDKRPHSFNSLFQQVETARLKRIVLLCLQWERRRPSFAVEVLEQDFLINLAGIEFRVRIDRLDRMENDKKWVIDYKSSLPKILPWNEDRPQEPQLLLYALLDEAINGLLFAPLKAGPLSCKGLSEENHPILGLSSIKKDENWNDYRLHWRDQLEELAKEFSQGYCHPQPANVSTCQQCHFQNLCRFSFS